LLIFQGHGVRERKDQEGQRKHCEYQGSDHKEFLWEPRSTEGLRFNTATRLDATAMFHQEEVASKPVRTDKNKDKTTRKPTKELRSVEKTTKTLLSARTF
jgi:hypothetical protein